MYLRKNAEKVLCNTTGWSLVFHKPDSRFHQPAFSLLACRTTMTAALVVRGTGSIQDVITDIQAMPVPFPAPRADAGSGETRCDTGLQRSCLSAGKRVKQVPGQRGSRGFARSNPIDMTRLLRCIHRAHRRARQSKRHLQR